MHSRSKLGVAIFHVIILYGQFAVCPYEESFSNLKHAQHEQSGLQCCSLQLDGWVMLVCEVFFAVCGRMWIMRHLPTEGAVCTSSVSDEACREIVSLFNETEVSLKCWITVQSSYWLHLYSYIFCNWKFINTSIGRFLNTSSIYSQNMP